MFDHATLGPAMLSNNEFSELMHRIRHGDQDAAKQLVQSYEPEIRRAARLRMTDPQLRRLVDSIDICQSVFGRFFKSASDGALQMQKPEQLLALLTTMTRNRVIDEHRRNTSQKRFADHSASQLDPTELLEKAKGPRTATVEKELLSEVRSRLRPDELAIADLRNSGQSWEKISAELNESADGLRKRLDRAIIRVRDEMNAQMADDEIRSSRTPIDT